MPTRKVGRMIIKPRWWRPNYARPKRLHLIYCFKDRGETVIAACGAWLNGPGCSLGYRPTTDETGLLDAVAEGLTLCPRCAERHARVQRGESAYQQPTAVYATFRHRRPSS